MPPLEINQSRYINASVRLDEPIAAQFAQYAAFTRASADDFVDKALDYALSKDCDLADFLKTPQAKQADSTLRGGVSTVLRTGRNVEEMWTRHPQVGNCAAPDSYFDVYAS